MADKEAYTGVDNLEVMAEAKNYNAYLTRMILSRLKEQDHVLDFGAGSGTFAALVSEAGFDVVCLEPDATLGGLLSDKGLRVMQDLDDIADESVDAVYSLNVLEHIEDDSSVVKKLHSKVRPGGRVFIYVPAFEVLFTSMDAKVGHLRRYKKGQLVRLAEQNGFAVEKARYADSAGFVATLLFKWFGNDSGDINRSALKLYDTWFFPVSLVLDCIFSRFFGKNVFIEARRI